MPNYESVDKTTNPYFKNTHAPYVAENEAEFVMVKHNFPIWFSILVTTATYKNIKKFVNKISRRTISGKQYAEDALRVEGCVNINIQEKDNLFPQTSLVDYADILMPIKKYVR